MRFRIVVLAVALLASGCGYNRIQSLDETVDANEANIQAELQRRNDLIPNLVTTVDEAAAFEQETFTAVAEARAGLTQARERMEQVLQREDAGAADIGPASDAVTENLRLFLNVSVEAYPTLTANQSFIRLQDELTETENRISVARRDYNEAVQVYNTYIRLFPLAITARVIGADRREPFAASAAAQEAPTVEFRRATARN